MSFTTEKQGLRSLESMCEQVGSTRLASLSARGTEYLEAALRICYLAIALGATAERAVAPAPPEQVCRPITPQTDVFSAMTMAYMEGLLGAAADLDPLDRGPAHLALPSLVAASVAADMTGGGDTIQEALLHGLAAGSRLRRAVTGPRPGSGFHSAGTFGTFAAAAAAARILDLSAADTANAISIALSRAGGLALNSAATWVGLSHFGWAAAHGLEAAWLASRGMKASTNVEAALRTFFPEAEIDLNVIVDPITPPLEDAIFFKRYPCNIYLNLVVMALHERHHDIDHINLVLPHVPHLDNPNPADVRAARNSAQAVAAIAAILPDTYASFTEPKLDLSPGSSVWRLMSNVEVTFDSDRASRIDDASVKVELWSGGRRRVMSEMAGIALAPWGRDHARHLVRGMTVEPLIDDLYLSSPTGAHRMVSELMVTNRGQEVRHES